MAEVAESTWTDETRAGVAFVGESLAPFFLQDPRTGTAGPSFEAIAGLDARAAAGEWPFVDAEEALAALQLMQEGLTDCFKRAESAAPSDAESVSSSGSMSGGGSEASSSAPAGMLAFYASDDLMWEYRRLFVGPARKAAPPWGSVYTDRDQVIFGKSTLDLRQWMREVGVEGHAAQGQPEDHIGLMLSLMAWLARQKPECLDDYLQLHLLTWAPHFLDLMERETQQSFYQGLARLTRASLQGIRMARGLQVNEPRFYR